MAKAETLARASLPSVRGEEALSRVVFTIALGAPRYGEMALGLARSLALVGDTTPRGLITDMDDPRFGRWFQQIARPPTGIPTYLQKLQALQVLDAESALFIDADSLAFGRLDPIWETCSGSPVAVQGYRQSKGHWYGHLEEVLPGLGLEWLPRFNGGLIYYERSDEFEKVRMEAARVAASYLETGLELFRGQVPDEPCLSIAMARTEIGTLLPDELDFMNTPVGLVGRLRLDVMKNECLFLKRGRRMRLIRPIVFHAAKYVNNTAYWRQLAILEWLDRYEQAHPYGYMSPTHKLRRSVERRLLKWLFRKPL